MLAIIRTGGKQYLVSEGEKVKVESIEGEPGSAVSFETLYVGDDKDAKVGTPVLEGAKVEGKILSQDRHDKVTGIKFKAKKRYRRRTGHRQELTKLTITGIKA